MKDKKAIDSLKKIFGEDIGTAKVLTTPSEGDKKVALASVDEISLELISRDLAILAARELSDVLQSLALRPADYVYIDGLVEKVISKIKKALSEKEYKDLFDHYFKEHLNMRG